MPAKIEWVSNIGTPGLPRDETDLSASFQCFCDSHNLYIAVVVIDDHLVFGQEVFSKTGYDDAVGIFFDGDLKETSKEGFDENDGQIRVSIDNTGKIFIEGWGPLYGHYPYFWESLGVRAAIQQNDTGYNVEISIPYKVLGWTELVPNRRIGMNVHVWDDDDGGDYDCLLGWAVDPDDISHLFTSCYNQVAFTESLEAPATHNYNSNEVSENGTKEIVAVIGNPDQSLTYNDVFSVLNKLSTKDFDTAETILKSKSDKKWSKYMLGMVQFDAGKYNESAETLSQLANDSSDRNVALWARFHLGNTYKNTGENEKARNEYETLISVINEDSGSLRIKNRILEFIAETYEAEGKFSQAAEELRKILQEKPVDWEFQYNKTLHALVRIGAYDDVINYWEKVIQNTNEIEKQLEAKIEIARNCFYKGDYDRASQIAQELINSGVDSKTAFKAQMVLLSISRKSSN